jgi:hypothetical protein
MKPLNTAAWRYRLHQAGWPAWLGVALVAAAVLAGPLLSDPLRAEATAWTAQADRARSTRATLPQDPVQRARDDAAAFLAQLPEGDAALAAVQDLHQLAQTHGVQLASGEYRLVPESGQRWQRYQITLPAQGSELALRRWMADALERWPSLALDDWSAAREQASQEAVQARVRWSFYLRQAS